MTLESVDLRRMASALIVIVLHVAVVAAFLHATLQRPTRAPLTREIVLQLLQPPKPAQPSNRAPNVQLIAPSATVPGAVTAPQEIPPPSSGANLHGLYLYLYECSPENFASLTEAERAKCASASLGPRPDETNSLRNLPSRAHDAPHWDRALARKKNPVLLPCMAAGGLPLTPTVLACLAKGAASGFGDLDEAPGYGDQPGVEAHVPNNGDPPSDPPHH